MQCGVCGAHQHTRTHIHTYEQQVKGLLVKWLICDLSTSCSQILRYGGMVEWWWYVSPVWECIRLIWFWMFYHFWVRFFFLVEVLGRYNVFKYYGFEAKPWAVAITAIAMTAACEWQIKLELLIFRFSNANEKYTCVIYSSNFELLPASQLFSNSEITLCINIFSNDSMWMGFTMLWEWIRRSWYI